MRKRDKRLLEYARLKAAKERGDKPDKRTVEQAEQFVALNEALKDELPKLYALTAKLVEACLSSFIKIQVDWFDMQQAKLRHLTTILPEDIQMIVEDWSVKFTAAEVQLLELGICNGSILADSIQGGGSWYSGSGTIASSGRRSSTVNSTSVRGGSFTTDELQKNPQEARQALPDSYRRTSRSPVGAAESAMSSRRGSINNILMGGPPDTAIEGQKNQTLRQVVGNNPSMTEPFPRLPSLDLESPNLDDVLDQRPISFYGSSLQQGQNPTAPPGVPLSRFFSPAMQSSNTPQSNEIDVESEAREGSNVLFLAASICEFNIDSARREAGYPYLMYEAGEIFDVIAEKGELWLAMNQDDPNHQVGWIWNKHFARLAP